MSSMLSRSGVRETSPVEYVVSPELDVEQLAHAALIVWLRLSLLTTAAKLSHPKIGRPTQWAVGSAELPADSPDPVAG
jgi:hypothetical protein